jgi:tripartite-type tricarboxylate transporter receptor subunit TctC
MPSRRSVLTAIAATYASHAWAQRSPADYPNKPIKIIVPFPAGGGGDTLARLMLSKLGPELGQSIVFENIGGAGGNVGVATGSRATADGYTLIYGTNGTHAINQTLYKNPGFDAMKDFEPISRLSRIAALLVIRPGLQVNSMRELLNELKKNPGKFTFASAGNGTTSHLAGETLKARAGLSAVHIPYRGGAAAITDVLADRIDFMIDVMPNTAPHVRSGRLKGLAVSTLQRVSTLPDVPTIAESGVPGFDVTAWDALFAPAGTPVAIIEKIGTAVQKVLADETLKQQLLSRGAEVSPTTPTALQAFVQSEVERWGQAIKRSGTAID